MSVGDHEGGPNMGVLWKLRCFEVWRSNMTGTGWGGPCFWRPTHGGCNRPGELRSKNCFERYAEDGSIVLKSGKKDRNKLCHDVIYSEDRVQRYTDERQTCKPCMFDHVYLSTDFYISSLMVFSIHGFEGLC